MLSVDKEWAGMNFACDVAWGTGYVTPVSVHMEDIKARTGVTISPAYPARQDFITAGTRTRAGSDSSLPFATREAKKYVACVIFKIQETLLFIYQWLCHALIPIVLFC